MSILAQQINMSKAMVNARTIMGQAGAGLVMNNLATSQLRGAGRNSDLVSGYFPGDASFDSGRSPFMYPDNRTTFVAGDVVSSSEGVESIKDSRTTAQIG